MRSHEVWAVEKRLKELFYTLADVLQQYRHHLLESEVSKMTCGCMFDEVDWDERILGNACGCTSCVDCGLINTQDPNPKNWKCHTDHPLSCTKEESE